VLAAIRAHDPQAARAAMQAHMDKSHARFSASWRRAKHS
jgi:DNA-binding GntR family transcriptional regulator